MSFVEVFSDFEKYGRRFFERSDIDSRSKFASKLRLLQEEQVKGSPNLTYNCTGEWSHRPPIEGYIGL